MNHIPSLGVIAAAVCGLVQTAAAQVSNPTGQLPNFDVPTIGPMIAELQPQAQVVNNNGAVVGITYLLPTGERVFLFPNACDSQGANCRGLSLQVPFIGGSAEYANHFNNQGTVAKAAYGNARTVLHQYIIGDYGMARGNLDVSLRVLGNGIRVYREISTGGTVQSVSLNVPRRHSNTGQSHSTDDLPLPHGVNRDQLDAIFDTYAGG